jgi:hypothetical protein
MKEVIAPKGAPETAIEYLDRPPSGEWFVLNVMRTEWRKWDWLALMIDVHPDELKHRLYKSALVRIPGKHRNRDAAWDALENMLATRH